jgi:hypothetical protein
MDELERLGGLDWNNQLLCVMADFDCPTTLQGGRLN